MRPFHAASSAASGLDVKNVLFMGPPSRELAGASNLAASPGDFVDASQHDYRLLPTSTAIDAGVSLTGVTTDRLGTLRPLQRFWDVGAFEYTPEYAPPGLGTAAVTAR